jgi:hypothetical protein
LCAPGSSAWPLCESADGAISPRRDSKTKTKTKTKNKRIDAAKETREGQTEHRDAGGGAGVAAAAALRVTVPLLIYARLSPFVFFSFSSHD